MESELSGTVGNGASGRLVRFFDRLLLWLLDGLARALLLLMNLTYYSGIVHSFEGTVRLSQRLLDITVFSSACRAFGWFSVVLGILH